MVQPTRILIIGAGMIGRGWAAAFLRAGMDVVLWSRQESTSRAALAYLQQALPILEQEDLLNGKTAADLLRQVVIEKDLALAVAGVDYVQENLPEDLETKTEIFAELDRIVPPTAIIASSTSSLLCSQFTEHVSGRDRCIVAHPLNPPSLIPATEVSPAPWTSETSVARTCEILEQAGQRIVLLEKELDGFVVNRLQGALLNEAFWLVANGYAKPEDIDVAVKHGLALRWSFMGPFETIDLNSPGGVREYAERYNAIYKRLHAQMRDRADWLGPWLDGIEKERRDKLPIVDHPDRQLWRDQRLMALARHKRETDNRLGQ